MLSTTPGWAISIEGPYENNDDDGQAIAVHSAGEVYVAGRYSGTADFDPEPIAKHELTALGQYSYDHFVAEYSAEGDFLWAHGLGGYGTEPGGISAKLDAAGRLYVVTHFSGEAHLDGQLTATLYAPDGTPVELFSNVGGSGDNFTGTVLDDQATTSITAGAASFTGTFEPEASLAAFNELDVAGTWTLEIIDDTKGESGTLNSWSIEVTSYVPEPNQPPVAGDDQAATDEDIPVTINVLANDSDPDGNPVTVTSVADPANGTAVDNVDGTITYTPYLGFNGTDGFIYTISDGNGGSDSATVTVYVAPASSDGFIDTNPGMQGNAGLDVSLGYESASFVHYSSRQDDAAQHFVFIGSYLAPHHLSDFAAEHLSHQSHVHAGDIHLVVGTFVDAPGAWHERQVSLEH